MLYHIIMKIFCGKDDPLRPIFLFLWLLENYWFVSAAGDLGNQMMSRLKLDKVAIHVKVVKNSWGFFNYFILFSELRRAEIFSLTTCLVKVILMDYMIAFLLPFSHYISFLTSQFYFLFFWVACSLGFSYQTYTAVFCLWPG